MEKIAWPHIGMSLEECADVLRIDRKLMFRALADGLPARKIGRAWRISPKALEDWLASGNLKPGGGKAVEPDAAEPGTEGNTADETGDAEADAPDDDGTEAPEEG